jgi:hypothetical protein
MQMKKISKALYLLDERSGHGRQLLLLLNRLLQLSLYLLDERSRHRRELLLLLNRLLQLSLYLLDERSRHGRELRLLLLNSLLQLRRRLDGLHNDGGRVHSSDHLLLKELSNFQSTYFKS